MVSYVIKDRGETRRKIRYVSVGEADKLYPSGIPHRYSSREVLRVWRKVRAMKMSRKDPERFIIERWDDG